VCKYSNQNILIYHITEAYLSNLLELVNNITVRWLADLYPGKTVYIELEADLGKDLKLC